MKKRSYSSPTRQLIRTMRLSCKARTSLWRSSKNLKLRKRSNSLSKVKALQKKRLKTVAGIISKKKLSVTHRKKTMSNKPSSNKLKLYLYKAKL